jgi:hypothetical protein
MRSLRARFSRRSSAADRPWLDQAGNNEPVFIVTSSNDRTPKDPGTQRRTNMSSKLTLSIAVALALTAVGGVARANPIPTTTDEARALNGQYTSQLSIDHNQQANAEVTSTDDARAVAGNTVPAPISPSVQSTIARDWGEERSRNGYEPQTVETPSTSLAQNPTDGATTAQGN